MHGRGIKTEGIELRAAVPVSIRSDDDHGSLGNRLTQLVAPLPVDVADPVARLRLVQQEMTGLKESKQALGAEIIAGAQEFAPPTILAQSTRLNFSTRAYNLLVTNVPGPQLPLYLLGRELDQIYPVAFLAGDRALAVAVDVLQRARRLRPDRRLRQARRHRRRRRRHQAEPRAST